MISGLCWAKAAPASPAVRSKTRFKVALLCVMLAARCHLDDNAVRVAELRRLGRPRRVEHGAAVLEPLQYGRRVEFFRQDAEVIDPRRLAAQRRAEPPPVEYRGMVAGGAARYPGSLTGAGPAFGPTFTLGFVGEATRPWLRIFHPRLGLTLSLAGRASWAGAACRSWRLERLDISTRVISPRRKVNGEVTIGALAIDER